LITHVYKEISELYEGLPKYYNGFDFETNLASFTALTNYHLIEFLFTFKENKWKDEKEYRLILKNEVHHPFRVHHLNEKTYIKIRLSQPAPDIPLLPIVGVFFGKQTSEHDKIEVCRSLLENGYDHVSIKELK